MRTLAVCADDYVSAVQVHADRVHDALRRAGCEPQLAAELTVASALDLLDALVHRPESVPDLVGAWFHRALRLAARSGSETRPMRALRRRDAAATSVLAGSPGEAQVRAALDKLPARDRLAVLLRDGYDLAPATVAAALGTGTDPAVGYAQGRLQLVAHYDDRPPPSLSAHPGTPPADLATLAELADGSLTGATATALRRHVDRCPICEEVVEVSAKGRRLAAGLPLMALSDEDRDALLAHVAARAHQLLPSRDEIVLASEVAAAAPVLRFGKVVLTLFGALLLGVLAGYLTRPTSFGDGLHLNISAPGAVGPSASPTPHRSATPSPTNVPLVFSPTPVTSPISARSPTPAPRPTSSPNATAAPVPASIAISPTAGPNGTVITVSGSGFSPGANVTVEFLDHAGAVTSTADTVAGSDGQFTTSVTASNPPAVLPEACTVSAAGGSRSASATFDDTSTSLG